MNTEIKPILVIGGGIAGMTAAVEAAEVGYGVVLVEKEAYLGGRVMRMHRYFPKMCPPTCGFEINLRRIRQNRRITVHTLATVTELSGRANAFKARIEVKPRYVTGEHPLDESAAAQLTSKRIDDFNYGMAKTPALYLPHSAAYPPQYLVDREALSPADAETLRKTVPHGAIDLEMTSKSFELEVGAVIVATGWHPYDAAKLNHLGFGQYPDVITNVMMERLASGEGPTGGEILRPSDQKKAQRVAFVQCAGSRDENHLPYCSAVCCMAALKQIRYLREKNEEAEATLFYIDIRTLGRLERFYLDMLEDEKVTFIKGKVAGISEDSESRKLMLDVEDTLSRERLHPRFDLVVLATGMVPDTAQVKRLFKVDEDDYGFIQGSTDGIYPAGCTQRPCDVSRTVKGSTAAVLKAIQSLHKGNGS